MISREGLKILEQDGNGASTPKSINLVHQRILQVIMATFGYSGYNFKYAHTTWEWIFVNQATCSSFFYKN
jgi:hypothetical protein